MRIGCSEILYRKHIAFTLFYFIAAALPPASYDANAASAPPPAAAARRLNAAAASHHDAAAALPPPPRPISPCLTPPSPPSLPSPPLEHGSQSLSWSADQCTLPHCQTPESEEFAVDASWCGGNWDTAEDTALLGWAYPRDNQLPVSCWLCTRPLCSVCWAAACGNTAND